MKRVKKQSLHPGIERISRAERRVGASAWAGHEATRASAERLAPARRSVDVRDRSPRILSMPKRGRESSMLVLGTRGLKARQRHLMRDMLRLLSKLC